MSVEMFFPYTHLRVRVDGQEVGRIKTPSLALPWVEYRFDRALSDAKLVAIVLPRSEFNATVFVDGLSLNDGRCESEWRIGVPEPMDDFAAMWLGHPWWGVRGALICGVSVGMVGVGAGVRDSNPVGLAFGAVGFTFTTGWFLMAYGFSIWLSHRPSWPGPIRTLLVLSFTLGLPIAIILVLKEVSGAS